MAGDINSLDIAAGIIIALIPYAMVRYGWMLTQLQERRWAKTFYSIAGNVLIVAGLFIAYVIVQIADKF